jgi:hypothetical protein
MIEINLPDGQSIPTVDDIKRLTSPDWHADWWHYEDAMSQNEDLTEDEAKEVLELMAKYSDPNIGISWDSIEVWCDLVINRRKEE